VGEKARERKGKGGKQENVEEYLIVIAKVGTSN
jgi:hypothetical protein